MKLRNRHDDDFLIKVLAVYANAFALFMIALVLILNGGWPANFIGTLSAIAFISAPLSTFAYIDRQNRSARLRVEMAEASNEMERNR